MMINGAFAFFSFLRTVSVGTEKWEVEGTDDGAYSDLYDQYCGAAQGPQSHVRVVESPYCYQ